MRQISNPSEVMPPENYEAIEQLLQKVDQLHTGPGVAQKLLSLTRDPNFEFSKVVECLEHDPALTGKILSVVNSSRYGLANSIQSVRHAATYLGRRSLRLSVLTFAMVDTLTDGAKQSFYQQYWQRALTMASVAERLARRHIRVSEDDAYTTGLLADLGILVLAQFDSERYFPLYNSVRHGAELLEAEQEQLGFTHPQLGAHLLHSWNLPEAVVAAASDHHQLPPDPQPLVLAVHAADLMADTMWTTNSPNVQTARRLMEEHFGLDLDDFIDLAISCHSDVAESAKTYGLDITPAEGCEQLLSEARRLHSEYSLDAAVELDSIESTIDDMTV